MKTRHVFVVYLLHVLHIRYLLYTSFTFTCYILCTLKTIQQFTHYTSIQWTDVTLTQSKQPLYVGGLIWKVIIKSVMDLRKIHYMYRWRTQSFLVVIVYDLSRSLERYTFLITLFVPVLYSPIYLFSFYSVYNETMQIHKCHRFKTQKYIFNISIVTVCHRMMW